MGVVLESAGCGALSRFFCDTLSSCVCRIHPELCLAHLHAQLSRWCLAFLRCYTPFALLHSICVCRIHPELCLAHLHAQLYRWCLAFLRCYTPFVFPGFTCLGSSRRCAPHSVNVCCRFRVDFVCFVLLAIFFSYELPILFGDFVESVVFISKFRMMLR